MNQLWIVIPAFNEAGQIAATLESLVEFLPRVVVVDDGSKDATAAEAVRSGATVLRHPTNLGQGAALQTGIEYALENGAEFVCTFDADGQHDPAAISGLYRHLIEQGADVVLASRFRGRAEGIPAMKRLVLRAAVAFTRLQTGLRVSDTHNGLRLFTRDAARAVQLRQSGMAHASEILATFAKKRFRISEYPTVVRYTEYSRAKGQSLSNSIKIVLELAYAALSH